MPAKRTLRRLRRVVPFVAGVASMTAQSVLDARPWVFGLLWLAVGVVAVYAYWPDIRRLRLAPDEQGEPTTSVLATAAVIGLALLACVSLGAWQFYWSIASAPTAVTPEIFAQRYINGLSLRLADFARDDEFIRDRIFENCTLYGPAVIVGDNTSSIKGSRWDGNFDEIFIEVPYGTHLIPTGAIGLENVLIRNCTLKRIQMLVSPEQKAFFREIDACYKRGAPPETCDREAAKRHVP